MSTNPLITEMPTMPVRGDEYETFTARSNAALGALSQLQSELNILGDWINTTSDAINLAKNTAVSVKDTAVAAKNTAVSAKDTAVAVKNTAVSAKDAAVAANNAAQIILDTLIPTVAATANTSVKRDGAADINARLFRTAYTTQTATPVSTVQVMMRNTTTDNYLRPVSRTAFIAFLANAALHADALRISGSNIQLVKANGASETINVGTLYKNIAVGGVGSTVTAKRIGINNVTAFGAVIAGSSLRISNSNNDNSVSLSGTWICTGYGFSGFATSWKRI